jgi:hypothetical protein
MWSLEGNDRQYSEWRRFDFNLDCLSGVCLCVLPQYRVYIVPMTIKTEANSSPSPSDERVYFRATHSQCDVYHGNKVPLHFHYKVATNKLTDNSQQNLSISSPVTDRHWGLNHACSGLLHLARPYLLQAINKVNSLWLIIMNYTRNNFRRRCLL